MYVYKLRPAEISKMISEQFLQIQMSMHWVFYFSFWNIEFPVSLQIYQTVSSIDRYKYIF